MKTRSRLIRATSGFYMISDNSNVSFGIIGCPIYTRPFAVKDDYHKKRMDKLSYTPVRFNYLETKAQISIIPARKNQFIQKTFSTMLQFVGTLFAIAWNTISAFTGSYTENQFWYDQFDLKQNRKIRVGQPNVDFDAADNCRIYVTTKKAMNLQGDIPSFLNDTLRDHYVLVFDLTSMQDAKENFQYPELVGEPPRLELNFVYPPEHVSELIVLGERMFSVAVDKFVVVEKYI